MRNFFRLAMRNLFRQKTYSLFNLIGLALGIACGLLLTLHIREELSFEKNFPKHQRIYRMVSDEWSKASPPLAREMMNFFPEIKSTVSFSDRGTNVVTTPFKTQGEVKGYFADSSAVDVFDLKPVAGDPVKALSEPSSIVINRSTAERLFGKRDPLGQKLVFGDREDMWVKAVIEDLPANTHLHFDYLASMATLNKRLPSQWANNRGWMFGWTYVLFNRPEDAALAQKRLKAFFIQYRQDIGNAKEIAEEAGKQRFQPLTDIHLKSDLIQEMGPNSSIVYIYIFIGVEVLILMIACVNFVNLFTTQALKRLKEVGMRKLLGASKKQLVLQFMGEAFILTMLAGLLAILIYLVSLPFYNSMTGRDVRPWEIIKPGNLLIVFSIIVSVGLVSGLFPALFISNFKPISSLKGIKTPKSSAIYVRKGLVVFQFVVSGLLIISSILVYRQTQLFRNKQLGFDKDQVLVARLYGNLKDRLMKEPEVLKNEILKNSDIIAVGSASNVIGDDLSVESVTPPNVSRQDDYPSVRVMRIDEHYLEALGIGLKEGRNFSTAFNDSASFIINEKAAQVLKLGHPLNSPLVNNTSDLAGKVVGVVGDFHFASLHHQVEPLVFEYRPQWTGNMFIKIRAGKTAETISFLKSAFSRISPNTLFSYGFLDEKVAGLYKKEDNMSGILKVFTGLAIIISCLGLFGLVAHAAETRTKEIGIRKVIGAGIGNLIGLLSKDLITLVLLGNLIAWPLAWWLVNKWLQEFTYKIDIGWTVFLLSALATLAIAMLTMAYHCIKTANSNPVRSLRTE